jgi:hypothetical protein
MADAPLKTPRTPPSPRALAVVAGLLVVTFAFAFGVVPYYALIADSDPSEWWIWLVCLSGLVLPLPALLALRWFWRWAVPSGSKLQLVASAFVGWLRLLTIGGFLLFAAYYGVVSSRLGAYSACESYMLAELDTPATAHFAGRFANATIVTPVLVPTPSPSPSSSPDYQIASFVDAQNRFGANVRTRFRCVVTWDEKAWHWSLVELRTALWSEPAP